MDNSQPLIAKKEIMPQIMARAFGRTGHPSTRTIYGSFALRGSSKSEAAEVLELLFKYGINHIDTAPKKVKIAGAEYRS